ncbi:MAG: hypothetical protein QGG53_37190 [Planctomycetota bacterium]|nr:hypothetical protein [Planctomycetota bacterium]
MFLLTAGCLSLLLIGCNGMKSAATEETRGKESLLLSAGSLWRKHYTFIPPRISEASARAEGLKVDPSSRESYLSSMITRGLNTPHPPSNWMKVDFDDTDWLQRPGAEFSGHRASLARRASLPDLPQPDRKHLVYLRGTDPFVEEIGLVSMRGKFVVMKRKKIRHLTLSISFRGGFVAYLNGKEVARAFMPEGKLQPTTPAKDYPLDAFKEPKPDANEDFYDAPAWALRERQIRLIEINRRHLKDGLNVLAIELHRSEFPAACRDKKFGLKFSPVGLATLSLKAHASAGALPQKEPGFHAWTAHVWQTLTTAERADPVEMTLKDFRPAIEIAAARNGTFAAHVIVRSRTPIDDLRIEKGELKAVTGTGVNAISDDNISFYYEALNPIYASGDFDWEHGLRSPRFDVLHFQPPESVPVTSTGKSEAWSSLIRSSLGLSTQPTRFAIQPIWVNIRVPRNTPPGDYRGVLLVQANYPDHVTEIPIRLHVADWTLPDLRDYTSLFFLYQSPDTLAKYYKVEPWTEKHWALIEKSLKLMGEIGNIGLIFPLTSKTQLGNSESMVPWIRQPDGSYRYDFSRFDRYLESALKYHDPVRLKVISLNVWGWEVAREGSARVTVMADGKKSDMKLPEYGSPECEDLWTPLLEQISDRLADKGLVEKIMFGIPADDHDPHPAHVAMFRNILPDAKWHREAHFDKKSYVYDISDRKKKTRVGCTTLIWGKPTPDPQNRRYYGWKYDPDHLILNFNRFGSPTLNLFGFPEPWKFHIWMESTLVNGRNGNGRVGGDYFRLAEPGENHGHDGWTGGTLFNRFPSSNVHNLSLGNTTTDLLSPGQDGPLSTVRLENARFGNQLAEARIFVERSLVENGPSLSKGLAEKCRSLLDSRTNAMRMHYTNSFDIWHDTERGRAPFGMQNWARNTRELFDLAGEVERVLKEKK